MSRKRKTTGEEAARLRALILAGCSLKQAAALTGKTPETLTCYASRLRTAGYDIPRFGGVRNKPKESKSRTYREKKSFLNGFGPKRRSVSLRRTACGI